MRDADSVGDLAFVLHSHMPYVEGFGTYPFGEEWLFDAVIRSYLPVLGLARGLTMTVTPVLADQLADPGVRQRLREFCRDYRVGSAAADLEQVPEECRPAVAAELARYREALATLEACGGDVLGLFAQAEAEGRVELMASAATHAVLPLLATDAGVRLQVSTGIDSHRRRFDWGGGFWLPECAYSPGLEDHLAAHGVEWFCVDQSAHGSPEAALTPVATPAGPVAFPIDWEAITWLWSLDGYPSHPDFAQFAGKSLRGMRMWRIGGGAYDPEAGRAAALAAADSFLSAARERLAAHAEREGGRGLLVFAIDTELIGHWWSEGPIWLEAVLAGAAEAGLSLTSLGAAREAHESGSPPLAASTWGENKDLSTWDSPPVRDLAWAARRLELRLLRALRSGLGAAAAERAARELLAVQASDWAFLDGRGQAGDYPFMRATDHAEALLQAIDSPRPQAPALRGLAPMLSLAPLLQP
jgi:1,4-alpha-glucan branching enzyme